MFPKEMLLKPEKTSKRETITTEREACCCWDAGQSAFEGLCIFGVKCYEVLEVLSAMN